MDSVFMESLSNEGTLSADFSFSWEDLFEEGERRIKSQLMGVMIIAPARDRPRLLTEREAIQRRIEEALASNNNRKLKQALHSQIRLLSILDSIRRIKKE